MPTFETKMICDTLVIINVQGGIVIDKKTQLEKELEELFDIRTAKLREEKRLTNESREAQKEIRLLSHMFRDEVPDVMIPVSDDEFLRWDYKTQQLLLVKGDIVQILEGTSRETMIKLRPFLTILVKQAKDFFND